MECPWEGPTFPHVSFFSVSLDSLDASTTKSFMKSTFSSSTASMNFSYPSSSSVKTRFPTSFWEWGVQKAKPKRINISCQKREIEKALDALNGWNSLVLGETIQCCSAPVRQLQIKHEKCQESKIYEPWQGKGVFQELKLWLCPLIKNTAKCFKALVLNNG